MVGQTVKHYRIEEELGKGGMGVVYRAQDLKLRRPVALKVLSETLTCDPDRRRRFLLEARSAGRLTHPSIAQVYDVDEDGGMTFIAMELVEGKTVSRLIRDQELDLLGAIDIAIQVGTGLAKAHEAGIIHRDIKSDNVILTGDGLAKILDFGLAKLLDPDTGEGGEGLSDMQTLAETQIGVVMGTVAYMSPEQARGRRVDHRSDVFSLGVMLYEMGTGQLPFQGTTPLDTMHAIAFEETRPMTSIRRNLPPDLQRIVSRCLRKRAEDRYPDARSLVEDLKVLRRDTESGKNRVLGFAGRVRDSIDSLRTLRTADYLWYAVAGVAAALVLYVLVYSNMDVGGIIALAFVSLLFYRSVRNRPQKMLQRFAAKAARIPEVRIIMAQDREVTVFVDRAPARLYQRIQSLMAACNKKLYTGDPMTVAIRQALTPEELEHVLSQPGVLFVRDEITDASP